MIFKTTTHKENRNDAIISKALKDIPCPQNIIPMAKGKIFNQLKMTIFIKPDIQHRDIEPELLSQIFEAIINNESGIEYRKMLFKMETSFWGKSFKDPRGPLDNLEIPYSYSSVTDTATIKWKHLSKLYSK